MHKRITSKFASANRSRSFRVTRDHHQQEAAEDYTELVADLIASKGEARLRDLSKALGISHVTALRTVRRLVRDGYLTTKPRAPIGLTTQGEKTAKRAKERHQIILEFLIQLGVQSEIAEIDTEGIEHHVSPQTLKAFKKFIAK